ncbi:MAG: hypothetical protein IJ220_01540 [Clostridia bacterium]|nr:hypothetical protein [Clostridia bacterium]
MKKNIIGNSILLVMLIILFSLIMQGRTNELPPQEEVPYVESAEYTQYYYEQLTEDQKTIYELLKKECFQFHSNIRLNRIPLSNVSIASYALSMDYPSLFWTSEYTYKTVGNDLVTEMIYSIPENADKDLSKIDEIVEQINIKMNSLHINNDYEKLKFFYDWIVENTEYESNSNSQDMRSVFLQSSSVCAGYARAFQYLCQKNNMECTYVSGYTINHESHAWNLVKLSDQYYWVDVTWGDPVYVGEKSNEINYNYFLVDDEDFMQTHTIENKNGMAFQYPKCTDNSLNYYRRNHSYFEEYDATSISEYLRGKFRNNIYSEIELKFSNKEEFDEFIYHHIQKNGAYIYEDIQAVNLLFYGTVHVDYTILEDANYVKINVELEG